MHIHRHRHEQDEPRHDQDEPKERQQQARRTPERKGDGKGTRKGKARVTPGVDKVREEAADPKRIRIRTESDPTMFWPRATHGPPMARPSRPETSKWTPGRAQNRAQTGSKRDQKVDRKIARKREPSGGIYERLGRPKTSLGCSEKRFFKKTRFTNM